VIPVPPAATMWLWVRLGLLRICSQCCRQSMLQLYSQEDPTVQALAHCARLHLHHLTVCV
jgi:hypothetical protein